MTLTEAVVGMIIVAVAVGGALQATVVARKQSVLADDRVTARTLLAAVEAQIGVLPYRDPQSSNAWIGVDPGESAASPAGWDDVDDADGWKGLPTIAGATADWSVSVVVHWAKSSDPASDTNSESGLKRITMTAKRGGRVILATEVLRAAP